MGFFGSTLAVAACGGKLSIPTPRLYAIEMKKTVHFVKYVPVVTLGHL